MLRLTAKMVFATLAVCTFKVVVRFVVLAEKCLCQFRGSGPFRGLHISIFLMPVRTPVPQPPCATGGFARTPYKNTLQAHFGSKQSPATNQSTS